LPRKRNGRPTQRLGARIAPFGFSKKPVLVFLLAVATDAASGLSRRLDLSVGGLSPEPEADHLGDSDGKTRHRLHQFLKMAPVQRASRWWAPKILLPGVPGGACPIETVA
jgi:hypothetical protein